MFKGSNPNYICVIDTANNPLINSELELFSSVTNDPGDQMETMIKVMQRLVVKINLTKHPAKETDDLENLAEIRAEIYVQQLKNPKEIYTIEINKIPSTSASGLQISNESDTLKAWDTFGTLAWLLSLLFNGRLDQKLKSPE